MDSLIPIFLLWVGPPFILGGGSAFVLRSRWGIAIAPLLLTAGLGLLLVVIWREVDCYNCADEVTWLEDPVTQGDWAWLFTIVASLMYAMALAESLIAWAVARALRHALNDAPSH